MMGVHTLFKCVHKNNLQFTTKPRTQIQ
jgi:hypothetical protein